MVVFRDLRVAGGDLLEGAGIVRLSNLLQPDSPQRTL